MRNVTMHWVGWTVGAIGVAALVACEKTEPPPTTAVPTASATPNVVAIAAPSSSSAPGNANAKPASAAASAKTETAKPGACTDVGSTPTWRYGLTATPLYDGTVVVIGGHQHDATGSVKDVDIFHPETRTFSKGPPMHDARANHAAASIVDMHHIVVAGEALSIETYDGVKQTWTNIGKVAHRAVGGTGVSLGPNALFIGGDFEYKGTLASGALLAGYGTVTPVSVPEGRVGDFAVQVGSGDAAIFGGHDQDQKPAPDLLFNGKSRTMTKGTTTDARALRLRSPSMPKGPYIHASPELVVTEDAAYTWDAASKVWTKRATFAHKHTAGAAAFLDTQVFVIGGLDAANAVGELCSL